MSKLYDLKQIIKATGLPERTVRYYLSQVLEAPAGTPGRKSYYDQLTVDQLTLAQQILMRDYDPEKGEVKPTLKEFRDWLDGLSADEIRRLVDMPYRIKPKALTQGRTVVRSGRQKDTDVRYSLKMPAGETEWSKHSSAAPQDLPADEKIEFGSMDTIEWPDYQSNHDEEDRTADTTSKPSRRDTATDYLDRVMGPGPARDAGPKSKPTPGKPPGDHRPSSRPWAIHRFGDDLEIRTRLKLSDEQRRQIHLAGELLRTALKGHQP